jgi:hypothetical protein
MKSLASRWISLHMAGSGSAAALQQFRIEVQVEVKVESASKKQSCMRSLASR